MEGKELFRIAKTKRNDEDRYVIICGHSRACKIDFRTEEEAWEYISQMQIDWDVIVTVVGEMFEIFYELKTKRK